MARAGYLVSGVIYLSLALSALRLVQGGGSSHGGDQSTQDWTGQLMAQPFGPLLVALVGLGVLGSAAFQLYKAFKADFEKDLETAKMSAREQDFAVRTGRLGHAARGVTMGVIGLFLIVASVRQQPSEARGLAGALAVRAIPTGRTFWRWSRWVWRRTACTCSWRRATAAWWCSRSCTVPGCARGAGRLTSRTPCARSGATPTSSECSLARASLS